jgi:hypothetical protein
LTFKANAPTGERELAMTNYVVALYAGGKARYCHHNFRETTRDTWRRFK